MNILEAHRKQQQLQDEIQTLHEKLLASTVVKAGEHPAESSMKQYHKIELLLKQLSTVCENISNTLSQTHIGDKSFMAVVGDGKVMDMRISIIEECLKKASTATAEDEVTIDTDTLSKQLDTLREIKHELDSKIIGAMENTHIS